MTYPKAKVVSRKDSEQYDALRPLLDGLYGDIRDLATKKQDGVLSKARIMMINKLLSEIRILLKDEPTAPFLDLLDEVNIPNNGDALVIVGQFRSAMEHYWLKHSDDNDFGEGRVWRVK